MTESAYPTLRIAHLYPSLLNVAGDGGNVMALVQRCAWRGIPTEVVDVEQGDTPDFTTFDLILFHGGQDVEMEVVAADLGLKVPSLREAADQGVVIFAVCAGLQLLGNRYIPSRRRRPWRARPSSTWKPTADQSASCSTPRSR